MADVKLAGTWLRSLGHVSALKWSTSWGEGPCGSLLASCSVAVSPTSDSPLLRINQPFEVWEGGVQVFGGVTTEPGSGFPWVLNAKGIGRRSADFDAVDSSGDPTTNPRVAVTQAIARGLQWSNATAFPNTSIGQDGDVPTMQRLDALLADWDGTAGKRWGTDDNGVAFIADDPTSPSYFLDASDLPIGVAADALATRVRARYVSSVDAGTGQPDGWLTVVVDDAAGIALYGVIEAQLDLTPRGYLIGGSGDATAFAQAHLTRLLTPQWTNRVTTNATRLRTPGGLPAHLSSVRAGQMVRLFNVPANLGGLRNELALDIVLGEVEFDTENPSELTIAPVDLAVRSLGDQSAQVARLARNAA